MEKPSPPPPVPVASPSAASSLPARPLLSPTLPLLFPLVSSSPLPSTPSLLPSLTRAKASPAAPPSRCPSPEEPGSLPHRTMVGEGELRAPRRSQPPGAVLPTRPTARCHQRLLRGGRGTTWARGTCQRGCVGAGVVSMIG